MMTIEEMEMLDFVLGIAEVCTICGTPHFAKSPICGDCWMVESMEVMEAEEPLRYEEA